MSRTITIKRKNGITYRAFWKDKLGELKVRCMTEYQNGIKEEWGCFDTLKQAKEYIKKYFPEDDDEEIPLF